MDIYPVDNLPDDDARYLAAFAKYKKLIGLFYFRQSGPYLEYHKGHRLEPLRYVAKNAFWAGLKFIPHKFYVRKIDAILTGGV